jgi:hypothetical protein
VVETASGERWFVKRWRSPSTSCHSTEVIRARRGCSDLFSLVPMSTILMAVTSFQRRFSIFTMDLKIFHVVYSRLTRGRQLTERHKPIYVIRILRIQGRCFVSDYSTHGEETALRAILDFKSKKGSRISSTPSETGLLTANGPISSPKYNVLTTSPFSALHPLRSPNQISDIEQT